MLGSRWCPNSLLSVGLKDTCTHLPAHVSSVVLQLRDPYQCALKGSSELPKNSRSQYVASEALMGFPVQLQDRSEKLGREKCSNSSPSNILDSIQSAPQSCPFTPDPKAPYGRKRVRASADKAVFVDKASAWMSVFSAQSP